MLLRNMREAERERGMCMCAIKLKRPRASTGETALYCEREREIPTRQRNSPPSRGGGGGRGGTKIK